MTPQQNPAYVDGKYVAKNHVGPRLRIRELAPLCTPRARNPRYPEQPFFPYSGSRNGLARDGPETGLMIAKEMVAQIPEVEKYYRRPLTDEEAGNFCMGAPLRGAIERVDPRPFMGEPGERGGRRPFSVSPGGMDILSTMTPPYVAAVMLRLLDLRPDSDVLLVGTGTGYAVRLIQECLDPQGRLYAIDVDRRMTERAGRELEKNGPDMKRVRPKLFSGDWGRSEFRARFDRIIFFAALPYLPAKAAQQLEFVQDGVIVYPQYAPYPGGEAFLGQLARLMVYRISIGGGGRLEQTLCKTDFFHPFVQLRPLGREEEMLQPIGEERGE